MAEVFGQPSTRILAVIVLHKMLPADSLAFRTIQTAISVLGEDESDARILLYDNTPGLNGRENLPHYTLYYAAQRNEGVAGAYNHALRVALSDEFTWLLTLDQDSGLPPDFLLRMRDVVIRYREAYEIAAIVPQIFHAEKLLSPVRIRPWGISYIQRGFTGIPRGETHAYNSASLYRVSALKQIGGFNPYFWLDYQDAYVYRQLHQHGRRVYVAGDIQVKHDLSLLSQERGPSTDRFRNFLQAESAFCDLYGGRIRGLVLTAQLLKRLLRQRAIGVDPEIRQLTGAELKRRIFQSSARRIQEWQSEMQQRTPHLPSDSGEIHTEQRPPISVCMAAYNGSRYITAQLESILSQLGERDEVVVVDDASTDDTAEKVLALGDYRIRLIKHSHNEGVSQTFEDAIRGASGAILFLSDQDDIWAPQKVDTILKAFRSHPDVTLIATDAALIDSDGVLIRESYFAGRGNFRPGLWANLRQNWFGGCTMAFRAKLIPDILPLPHEYNVLHDLWIGVRNSLSGHRTLFINEPLVLNRRHSTTTTGRTRRTIGHKFRDRFDLLAALAEFWIRRTRGFAGHWFRPDEIK